MRTFDEIFATALAPRRFNTWLVALFGLTAMVLAAIGAYGVMAASVAAAPASWACARRSAPRPGTCAASCSARRRCWPWWPRCVGLALAAGGSGLLRSLLYDVAPRDPRMLAVAAGHASSPWPSPRRGCRPAAPLASTRSTRCASIG